MDSGLINTTGETEVVRTADGVPLARVSRDASGVVTKASAERAVSAFQQLGDALRGKPLPSSGRNEDRYTDRRRSTRQRKDNARRARAEMQRDQTFDTLRAQIRVASGETSASPAMVENARKALAAKVTAVQRANPELTEEQAAEVVYRAAAGA